MTNTWPTITALVDWLDESNGTTEHETAMRLIKLTEEVGEVSQAYIGMQGQNPRKGVTHQGADVAAELCDVIVTAMVALHSFTDDPAGVFAAKAQKIAARVGVEPASASAHRPRRGDEVEAWLKTQRDGCVSYPVQYEAADGLLDLYRLHADTRTPLGEHACEQHCDCDEGAGISAGEVEVPRYPVTNEELAALPILDMSAFHRANLGTEPTT